MIEFVIIYFLSKKIGNIAERKGQSKIKWILIFVGLWIGGELLASAIGIGMIYSFNLPKEWIYAVLFLLSPLGAMSGVLITFKLLNKLPNLTEEDIEKSIKPVINEQESWICPSCFHKNVGTNLDVCSVCNAKRSNQR